ncbi:hypothetical protein [Leptolyngbya sp. 7M]|uniref:hypothetical protein n=1 Tax=Leptolyngbya sp. 7M TaxID=2812896 RepID=UPI001B8C3236|nr:hypothetical protein [Leptolyngbya sp. 7M]QYO61943.1 hypothetical protein JVX88_17585 [Leptolyngbya sp. 7M]
MIDVKIPEFQRSDIEHIIRKPWEQCLDHFEVFAASGRKCHSDTAAPNSRTKSIDNTTAASKRSYGLSIDLFDVVYPKPLGVVKKPTYYLHYRPAPIKPEAIENDPVKERKNRRDYQGKNCSSNSVHFLLNVKKKSGNEQQ